MHTTTHARIGVSGFIRKALCLCSTNMPEHAYIAIYSSNNRDIFTTLRKLLPHWIFD